MTLFRFLDADEEFETETHHNEHNDDKPWGEVIGASLLIQSITLIGVFTSAMVTATSRIRAKNGKSDLSHTIHSVIIPAFGAGALIATAVFLMIPESLELIGGGHEEHGGEPTIESHNEASWKFGAALLGGFLLPAILHAVFPHSHVDPDTVEDDIDQTQALEPEKSTVAIHKGDDEEIADEKEESALEKTATEPPKQVIDWSLAASILVGDFFHNFTDGVFLGASFQLCGSDIGWTIVATTIYHELAQEIADFGLLTHHAGLKVWQALLLNFCAGFSIFLGAVIVLGSNVSDMATGSLLAMSAGVYFYIAGVECIPRAQKAARTVWVKLIFLLCFVVGTVPIGLVLLNHGHCSS